MLAESNGASSFAIEVGGHIAIGCEEQWLETDDNLLISSVREASVSYVCMHA